MQLKSQFIVGLIVVIFLLGQASQIAVTPLGEGMDFYGHLAYIVFFAEQGHAPQPDEASVPAWIVDLEAALPAPDASWTGQKYRVWATLSPLERQKRQSPLLEIPSNSLYRWPNYQSQHPPLYYWLMSRIYLWLRPGLTLEQLIYVLNLLTIGLAALGLPAIYLTLRLSVDKKIALLGLTAIAWYPNLLGFLGRITNDTLAFPLITWGLYCCCAARTTTSLGKITWAGVLLGLSIFTKTYALTLFPVYLLSALLGPAGLNWRRLGWASALSGLGLGALLLFNYITTGHFILLYQIRLTDSIPLLERLAAMTRLDFFWFFGGLIRGFWWSGYWSFVSPGLFYYLPLLSGAFFLRRPLMSHPAPPLFALSQLWPHYLALAGFVGGLLWHATTFSVYAGLIGETVHSGNEGWYAIVLIGSVFSVALVLLQQRLSTAQLQTVSIALVIFFVLWNLLARVTMAAYWNGLAGLEGTARAIRWGEVWQALTLGSVNLSSWLSLPGITQPVVFSFLLPLLMAWLLTGGVIFAVLHHPTASVIQPNPATMM